MAKLLQAEKDKKNIEHLLEVQSKTAAMGEMIGNIAHQWRQPLSIISTLSTSIQADIFVGQKPTYENIVKKMENINAQAQYLSKTIDDFREFLKSDDTNKTKINLVDVVKYTYDIVSDSMKDNYINCIKDMEDVYILGNISYLSQSFINICNNAKDAMVENNLEDRYMFLTVKKENNKAKVIFRDSGGGIDETIINKIYEPYFTTKNKSVGTGIGLYMTFKAVTQKYKGTIAAKNVEYEYNGKKLKGAEFTILFPISEEE